MSYKLFFDGSKKDKFITYGCVIYKDKDIIQTLNGQVKCRYINSHMAEYVALIMGLLTCINLNLDNIEVFGDAKNVIEQMENAKFRTHKTFYPFYIVSRMLSQHFKKIKFTWIERSHNSEADTLTRISYGKEQRRNQI